MKVPISEPGRAGERERGRDQRHARRRRLRLRLRHGFRALLDSLLLRRHRRRRARFGLRVDDAAKGGHEPREARAPVGVDHRERVAAGQRRELGRQLVLAGHRRTAHEHRDHDRLAGQGEADLEPDEVLRVVQAALAVELLGAEPAAADDDEHGIGRAHRRVQALHEVDSRLERVDVHEHLMGAELLDQPVVEPARVCRRILAAIADEDLGRACPPSRAAAGSGTTLSVRGVPDSGKRGASRCARP